jgi:spore coat polysaccharide biosynthesis protein SpsF
MRFGVIVAARTGSSRLPGKALLPLKGVPMVLFLIRRLFTSRLAEQIVFATTTLVDDDFLSWLVSRDGVPVFRGANEDVVERYVDAAEKFGIEFVVRVTGDCPFVDGETLDYCLNYCEKLGRFDLATTKKRFPVGIDYEIYRADVMKALHNDGGLSVNDREHLTKYFYDHSEKYIVRGIEPDPAWRWEGTPFTVDTVEDYKYCKGLSESFETIYFGIRDLIQRAGR